MRHMALAGEASLALDHAQLFGLDPGILEVDPAEVARQNMLRENTYLQVRGHALGIRVDDCVQSWQDLPSMQAPPQGSCRTECQGARLRARTHKLLSGACSSRCRRARCTLWTARRAWRQPRLFWKPLRRGCSGWMLSGASLLAAAALRPSASCRQGPGHAHTLNAIRQRAHALVMLQQITVTVDAVSTPRLLYFPRGLSDESCMLRWPAGVR